MKSPPPAVHRVSSATSSSGGCTHAVLQFVCHTDWRIAAHNDESREAFLLNCAELIGSNLRSLLTRINPAWQALLADELRNVSNDSVFLPWDHMDAPGMGWQLQSLACAGQVAVTLVPVLDPEMDNEVPEEGFSADAGSLRMTLRNLLLRTQQQDLRFRHFMRHLPGAYFTQNRDLTFALLNDSLATLLGESAIARLRSGEHWWEWLHPADLNDFNRNLDLCRNGRVPVSFRFRLRLPQEDRVLYLMDLRLPVRGINGQLKGYEGIWLDLTRETIAEKRLQQAAWKETLAEVSGSLSHDFNNVLTGIRSLSGLVYDGASPQDEYYEYLRIIRDTAHQAQGLIQRIVSLNREQSGHIALHNLRHIIHDQEELIRIILPRDSSFEVELPDGEIPVRLDAVAFRRILMNFATNARDALGRKGKVLLKVEQVDLAAVERRFLLSNRCPEDGQAVMLSFEDDGCGIEPELLHRIFGPYFSTKQACHGSGLGLYSVTQFARENEFDFGVASEPGHGTKMLLLIPLENLELDSAAQDFPASELTADIPCRGQACVFGRPGECVHSVVEILRNNGLDITFVQDDVQQALEAMQHPGPARLLIHCMDHSSELNRALVAGLRQGCSRGLVVLALKGINPDRFTDLLGKTFDMLFSDSDCPADIARQMLQTLETAVDSATEEGEGHA